MSSLHIAQVAVSDKAALQSVLALYRRSKSTLGFMPDGAFIEAAAQGTLIVARSDGEVIAYALFRLTKGRVRLSHLCVRNDRRRQGIALELVEWIASRHADYQGIVVRCRHDYQLQRMWSAAGFTQLSESPGRSDDRHPLVYWWRDHGHPTLFNRPLDSPLVQAAVDLNILRDIHDPTRPGAENSLALVSDQFSDLIELVRTSALDEEIASLGDDLRPALTLEAQRLTTVSEDGERSRKARMALSGAIAATDPGFVATADGEQDLRHVAAAIGAGLGVFTTRDRALSRVLGPPAAVHGLRILAPDDVIVRVDELARADEYRPAAVQQTTLTRRRLVAGDDESVVATLRNASAKERPRDLVALLRKAAGSNVDRWGVFGEGGELFAAFVHESRPHELVVSLLRTAEHPLAGTLARQILFLLRQDARRMGKPALALTDPSPSEPVRAAAVADGFVSADGYRCALVLPVIGSSDEVSAYATAAARSAGLPEPPLPVPGMSAISAAELERAWWPAKILDSYMANYLIPIRHGFSTELLGIPRGLVPRDRVLGLSREHVYFRSPRGLRPRAPSRLIWYMSQKGAPSHVTPGVVACSQLEAVTEGSPEALHERFRHLGVWQLQQVQAASRGGQAQALRFANTEVFQSPVPLARLRQITRVPLGPTELTAEQFTKLYSAGTAG